MSEKDIKPPSSGEQDLLTLHNDDLLKLFEDLPFRQKVQKVLRGLRAPRDSGDYKYARLQILRLWAPFTAVVIPALAVIGLLVFSTVAPEYERAVDVTIVEPEPLDKLEDIKELEQLEPPEVTDIAPDMPLSDVSTPDVAAPQVAGPFSPQPAAFDSVAIVKSPVILKGIYGSRSPGSRGSALKAYGAPPGTEAAVLLALRWLKKYQDPSGKWVSGCGGGPSGYFPSSPAMTGLALLTFLAHGETPASEEFGPTVEKAIKWLINNQSPNGHFDNEADENEYSHPIATYALCEAYAITKIPMIKEAANKAVEVIIKGQNPQNKLWNYSFDPSKYMRDKGKERNDISFSGWCIQALKAASLAGLDTPGLKDAMRKALEGLKLNYRPVGEAGGFCYTTGPDEYPGPLTGVGVLCMQLLGAAKDEKTKMGLKLLEQATCDWEKPWSTNPIYNWYYTTQAKFHAGGATWSSWNKQFAVQLMKNQIIVPKAIEDPQGRLVDIGYWKAAAPGDPAKKVPGEHCQSYVYNTTLCALTLQVYYRYLPTYKPPQDAELEVTFEDKEKDIDIRVR